MPIVEDQIAEREQSVSARIAGLSRALSVLGTPLYSNAFYIGVSQAGGGVAGLAFWAMVARLYSAGDVGRGSAALSLLILITTASSLGLGLGLIRFSSEHGAQQLRLTNIAFTASAVAATIATTVVLIGLPFWAPSLDFLVRQPSYAVAFLTFAIGGTISVVQPYSFMAIRRARYILVQFVFLNLSRLVLPAPMAVFFGSFGIVASGGIAMLVGGAIGFVLLARGLPHYRPAVAIDRATISSLLPFSIANFVADLLLLSPGLILPLLVVTVLGPEEGAYFYVAWFLGFFLVAISSYLALSLFSEGSRHPESLQNLSRSAVSGALAVAVLGGLFLFLLGGKMLLIFGPDYATEGTALLRIMAVAALPAAAVNVYIGTLRALNRTAEMVIIAGVVGVTTVTLGFLLLPVMGLTGAGVGHGLAYGVVFVTLGGKKLGAGREPIAETIRRSFTFLSRRS